MLEGPAFDKEGNLFVTAPGKGRVYKITSQKQISIVFSDEKVIVDGSAFHKDGRLFIVCVSGELLIIDPNDNKASFLYPKYGDKTLSMNDLVFDNKGNIYVTDFTGSIANPSGGVYRISEDAKTVQPVLPNLASPNGVSFSPEGNKLWISESSRNTILNVSLSEDGFPLNSGIAIVCAYYLTGFPGPDSNKVDIQGNLYQCIIGQGRIIVLSANGIPVANVLLKGRDEGKYLMSTNLAFKPGTSEGYITTGGHGGAWIFKFKGLAKGLPLFSHS